MLSLASPYAMGLAQMGFAQAASSRTIGATKASMSSSIVSKAHIQRTSLAAGFQS
jgi:hypothetical protein